MSVRKHDGLRDAEVRIIPGPRAGHRHHVAFLDRVPLPAVADQDARAGQFQIPVGDFACHIFHVNIEMRVRIDPLHPSHYARQVDLFGVVEHCRTGMVRSGRQP